MAWPAIIEGSTKAVKSFWEAIFTEAEQIATEAALKTEVEAAIAVATTNVSTTGVPSKAASEAEFGVAVSEGQTVLLVGQTNPTENGPRVISSGAWPRPATFAAGSTQWGTFVPVLSGTVAGATYLLTNPQKATVDTSALTWTINSAGSGVIGLESITGSMVAHGAITPSKVSGGVVTNVEKQITAATEVVTLNLSEAQTFVVKMQVAKVKFVIEGAPAGPIEIVLLPEWTSTGGATTFAIETAAGNALKWVGGTEPSWETAATARAYIAILALEGGQELFGIAAATASTFHYNEAAANFYAGAGALGKVTTGKRDIAIGASALANLTTGTDDIAIGDHAGFEGTTGEANIWLGTEAGYTNKTGNQNVGIGYKALNKTTGSAATALGYEALSQNTASNVTAVGSFALGSNTSGTGNTAFGHSALFTNKTGTNNTAIGAGALEKATKNSNTAVGGGALAALTIGEENTAIGQAAMGSATEAVQNFAGGRSALGLLTTGVHNVAIGYNAGGALTTQGGNTLLGWEAGAAITESGKLIITAGSGSGALVYGDGEKGEVGFHGVKSTKAATITELGAGPTSEQIRTAVNQAIAAIKGKGIIA